MKKLLALILVFILTLSNLLTYDSYGNQIIENEYNYSGGSGISGDPYVIKTSEDLQNISHNLTSSFIQDNNIDLSGIENWSPIGSSSTEPFIGIYDGNGYS